LNIIVDGPAARMTYGGTGNTIMSINYTTIKTPLASCSGGVFPVYLTPNTHSISYLPTYGNCSIWAIPTGISGIGVLNPWMISLRWVFSRINFVIRFRRDISPTIRPSKTITIVRTITLKQV